MSLPDGPLSPRPATLDCQPGVPKRDGEANTERPKRYAQVSGGAGMWAVVQRIGVAGSAISGILCKYVTVNSLLRD